LELRTGTKGVFRVTVDDEVVYDKAVTGRKPHAGEVGGALERRLGPPLRWRKAQR
jgi:predicted Rdx family selenoprotein